MSEIQVAQLNAMVRNPTLIASEINVIKMQTKQVLLHASIEIGRRLCEAKSLLSHGEWGEWLEAKVEYSASTANNLMRLFDAYGADQITLLDNNVKSPAFESLSYSKAVALLGIPDDEREVFVETHNIEDMSTRELQRVIKERDEAIRQQHEIEADAAEMSVATVEAQERARALAAETEEMRKQLANMKKQADAEKKSAVDKATEQAVIARAEAAELKRKLKESEARPMAVHAGATDEDIAAERAKLVVEYTAKLAALQADADAAEKRAKDLQDRMARQTNASAAKYEVLFDSIAKSFGNLLVCLSDIQQHDQEMHTRYSTAVKGLLQKMDERLA